MDNVEKITAGKSFFMIIGDGGMLRREIKNE